MFDRIRISLKPEAIRPSFQMIRATIIPMALAALLLVACGRKIHIEPEIRPVRSAVVEKQNVVDPIVITGHVRARDEISLAFRLTGKMVKRSVDVGDQVKAGQIVGRLDDQIERNALNAARADLLAAQAAFEQAAAYERRMNKLLTENVVSRNEYEVALRQMKTTKAQADAAQAKLQSAEEQLGFTELPSDATGVITQKGAEPGEVVQAGQMILTVARQNGRDAVFGMPAQVIRNGLVIGQEVEVVLADNHDIKAVGRIREISPEADAATRNHQIKVELADTPPGMLLGATVVGRLEIKADPLIEIPSPALTAIEQQPAVWVFNAQESRVHLRAVEIARYTPTSVIVTDGLQTGERIVTGGVQQLHEGQSVRLMEDPS